MSKPNFRRKLQFERCENRVVLTGACQAFGAEVAAAAKTGELGHDVSEVAKGTPGDVAAVTHEWQELFCGCD